MPSYIKNLAVPKGVRTTTTVNSSGQATTVVQAVANYSGNRSWTTSDNHDHSLPHPYSNDAVLGQTLLEGASGSYARYGKTSVTIQGPQSVVLATPALPGNWIGDTYNTALSRLYGEIRGQVDLSLMVAETPENVRFMRNVGKMVRKIIDTRDLLKGRWIKGWQHPTNAAGSAWLAWQYAIKPTVQDVYAAAEQLHARTSSMTRVMKTAKAHASVRTSTLLAGPGTYLSVTRDASYRVKAEVLFEISNSTIQSCGDWSSLNPASIAWELLPLSFVADWAYNVGGYIRNLESAYLYRNDFRSGYVSTSEKHEITGTGGGVNTTDPSTIYWYGMSGSRKQVKHNRQILQSIPIPDAPRFKVNLGSERLLSAASLLSQLLVKSKTPTRSPGPSESGRNTWYKWTDVPW